MEPTTVIFVISFIMIVAIALSWGSSDRRHR